MAQLVILIYGGHLVLNGDVSVGDLVFFFTCLNMLLQPIRMAGWFITTVQRAAVSARRLFEIFDAKPEIEDSPSSVVPSRIRGEFILSNLSVISPFSIILLTA